mgnify:FL=1
MRKTVNILLVLGALAAFLSCQREEEFIGTPELEDGGIRLVFECGGEETKAATMDGEDQYNENTLTTIDYFLYPEGETGSDAYIKGRVTLSGRTSYNVLVNTTELNRLFSGAAAGSKCDVYAIANYPGPTTDFDSASDTLTLRGLALSNHFNSAVVQTDFVMSGRTKATVINKNQTKAAQGTVKLSRAASKISFECSIADHVDITNYIYSGGEIIGTTTTRWVPLLSQMGVYLVNGFSDGTVGGDPVEVDEGSLYRYSQRSLTDDDSDGWYTCDPFYSYPQTWNSGDSREPFLKLVVPWGYLNSSGVQAGQKQFYYKVPCPGLQMEANTWYHIKLDVAILGSDDFEAMLEVNGEYYVLPWNTQTIVEADAEVKDARYISAPSNRYEMYNTSDLTFNVSSSHDCTLNLKSVVATNFKTGAQTDYTTTADGSWITYNHPTLTIDHTLNNDISISSFDSSPYVFTFEIRHSDNSSYTTGDIVVTQYPAMYITSELSNGYVYVNGTTYSGTETSKKVYDNRGSSTAYSLGSIVDPSGITNSGDNTNPYQYTIYATSLPSDSPYVIGDPRFGITSAVSNLTGLGSGYKPTAENTQNFISPAFKIASSYGKTTALWYENSQERCAAYQENGYPAGRWRLPTEAEIQFLVSLSEYNKIPQLFTVTNYTNTTINYWTGNYLTYYWAGGGLGYGLYDVLDFNDRTKVEWNNQAYSFNLTYGGTSYARHAVYTRCVYDVWDWGEDKDEDHLTSWGGFQTH